ncbi:uncharacterized protein LTR77_003442 [Saxophila tyrrhenica]|uniref:F-box domain-containing protein n=1 Tax=Saxophila tyrrhenica TaxID=1690608 RepID=A0AAV9PGK5_9PEZI|nr:hypothetical protein LTR77_003442 [Saxophila tyrrhenica]
MAEEVPPLLRLPAELVQHILSFLNPFSLARVAQTCNALRTQSYDDRIWQPHVNEHSPTPILDSRPLKSFRELYVAHHPYWFLLRNQIWFADTFPNGKLVICRYDGNEGAIVAHAIVASRTSHTLQRWEKDLDVIIHSFDPYVGLNLERPVLRLGADSQKTDDQPNNFPSDRGYGQPSKYSKEVIMEMHAESGLFSSFMLCRAIPEAAMFDGIRAWPPLRFPATTRARNSTQDSYESAGHRPNALSEVSESNFRLRKWVEYNGRRSSPRLLDFTSPNGLAAALGLTGRTLTTTVSTNGDGGMSIRMPEDISTYATLPRSCYMPTAEKPWQGIYCGDYSGHGCEFIVVRQLTKDEAGPLPEGIDPLQGYFQGNDRPVLASNPDEDWSTQADSDREDAPTGRIEAIKLTGDINIPRGEHTFIAPDIGHAGLVRIADEEVFRGARIVRSAGHIAHHGFQMDEWMPSQLIMVSHDTLCQYWTSFGHMSYYRRVDLDALFNYSAADGGEAC